MEQLPKIVQRGLRATATPGVHLDPDLLAAFVEKALNDRERAQVLQHLAECVDCREVISLATPEIVPALPASPERSFWLSWPMLRWGALAACVIVVSAAVTLRHEWQINDRQINERRQNTESSATEKATTAPGNVTAESNAPKPPADMLAAKIAPPAPFQSDRDFGTSAGKLAKQPQKTIDAATAAAGAGVSTSHQLEQNQLVQNKKVQESTNNQSANADAVKSANKIPGTVAAPSAPVPADRIAQAEPPSVAQNPRNDIGSSAETVTVTVQSEAAPVATTTNPAERKAKDDSNQNESHKGIQTARAAVAGAMVMGDRKTDTPSSNKTTPSATAEYAKRSQAGNSAPRWTLSADGNLQRSFDSGKNWQTIPVADNTVFRALAANDSDIWVGGAAGALYHSSDAGQNWTQVKPAADGKLLTADIVTIEFDDAQHGKVTTANRETWTTSDAGNSWQSH
jgi:Photosynthesis system II assembly factor YCF48/Putative zinc-finger